MSSQRFPASTDSVCKRQVHLIMLFFIEPQYLQKSTLQILMPQWTLEVPLHEHVCERHWLTDVTADTSFTNIYKKELVQPLVKGCRMLQISFWVGPARQFKTAEMLGKQKHNSNYCTRKDVTQNCCLSHMWRLQKCFKAGEKYTKKDIKKTTKLIQLFLSICSCKSYRLQGNAKTHQHFG